MSSTAVQFHDPYDYDPTAMNQYASTPMSTGQNLFSKIVAGLGGPDQEAVYQRYQTMDDRAYERASINSARAWDEYMDSTKYQRMKDDLEKAGMNPWLALQQGISATTSSNTVPGSTAKNSSYKGEKESKSTEAVKNVALTLFATAKLLAMLG